MASPSRSPWKARRLFFKPILAGASLADRLVVSVGALLAITATYVTMALLFGWSTSSVLLVAPMGASAVLVFAVPASPLAQPWPVIGGNVVSVLIGVTAARFIPALPLAAGVAVGGAIATMSLMRCLHPPGGAAALVVVIGGPTVTSAGYLFALEPVAMNAVVLTVAGLLFHRVSGHSYPHRPLLRPTAGLGGSPDLLHRSDLDAALADLHETFDISRDDLDALLRRAEAHAARRRATGLPAGG